MYLKDIEVFLTKDKKHIIDIFSGEIFMLESDVEFLKVYENKEYTNENEKDVYDFIISNLKRKEKKRRTPTIKEVDTIRINVSNACNLSCKYCYAGGGNYGFNNSLLNLKVAEEIVDFIKKYMNHINTIFFFGGEPLLNIEAIEYICKEFPEKKFSLITNGTILNDDIIKVIKSHQIKIAISIDGPKEIHDLNRITNDNKPTFDIVTANIKKLKKNNINGVSLQSTFTSYINKTMSKDDLIEFFDNNFDFRYLTIGDDINDKNLEYYENKDIIVKYIKEKNKVIAGITNNALLSIKTHHRRENKCGASNNMILIYPSGDIYPCQMFIGDSEHKLENIHNFNIEKFNFNRRKFNQTFLENEKCDECLAKYICDICPKNISNIETETCNKIVNYCNEIYNELPMYAKDIFLMNKIESLYTIEAEA